MGCYIYIWPKKDIQILFKGKDMLIDKRKRPNIELRTKVFILGINCRKRERCNKDVARSTVQLYRWETMTKERVRSLSNVIKVKSME